MAAKKAARSRRRKHPGIVLLKPEPERRIGWRARYRDPDSGKLVKESLPEIEARTVRGREQWAQRKLKVLARRRIELESGGVRRTGTALEAGAARYYTDHGHLRPATLDVYRLATNRFLGWAAKHGLRSADDLDQAKLLAYRASLLRAPRRASEAGGRRGQRIESADRLSPSSVNRELRTLQTVLTYLRRLGLLPRLPSDALSDALRRVPVAHERIEFLRPPDLRKLLDAARRHDAATFFETREEHAGEGERGSTRRYEPIAPLIAVTLLTGMRLGEAHGLRWDQVDLDALDNQGRKVGEIHLEGSSTKTRRARTVGLEVSPSLRRLMAALKLAAPAGEPEVFPMTRATVEAAARRLKWKYGAPEAFTWQSLRRTCGTFLTNSPGIFGASSAYRSAKQLGHSVIVAEKHYLDVERGIPREARTLEAAMQIEGELDLLIEACGLPGRARKAIG